MTQRDNNSACGAALAAFVSRDFSGWNGLPASCTIDHVLNYFGAGEMNAISGRLGQRAAHYYSLQIIGYQNPVRFWFRVETLVLIEAEYPTLKNDLAALQDELGSPSVRYNFTWRDLTLAKAQWVYADQGITLVVNPDNHILLYLTVFTPTSLDDYDQALFLDRPVFRTQRR